jgi:uncharacterized protein HemX
MENIRQAVNALLNQLKNHPLIDQKELVSVHLNYLTQQGPQVQIICFTKKMEQSDYQEVIQEVLLLAIEIFEKNQVAILFNTLGLTSR